MDKAKYLDSTNFEFLAEHDALFVELAGVAERSFASDPNTTLIKLRQLGEAIAQHIAALSGIEFDEQTSQADLLFRLNREVGLESVVRELFHTLRIEGNRATHQFRTQHKEAVSMAVKIDPLLANKIDPPAIRFCSLFPSVGNFLLRA